MEISFKAAAVIWQNVLIKNAYTYIFIVWVIMEKLVKINTFKSYNAKKQLQIIIYLTIFKFKF